MKPKTKKILQDMIDTGKIYTFENQQEIAKQLNLTRESIRLHLKNLDFNYFSQKNSVERKSKGVDVFYIFYNIYEKTTDTFATQAEKMGIRKETIYIAIKEGSLSNNLKEKILLVYCDVLTEKQKQQLL